MKTFTFYWLDGKRDVLIGSNSADALNRAGYGQGAISALDFWCEGDNQEYAFIAGHWEKEATCQQMPK